MTVSAPEMLYRYEVMGTWGEVPEWISRMVGEPDSFMLYPEDRGEWSQQGFYREGQGTIGGWSLERRGAAMVLDGHIIERLTEADLSDDEPDDTDSPIGPVSDADPTTPQAT